jgi:hypothetical protein
MSKTLYTHRLAILLLLVFSVERESVSSYPHGLRSKERRSKDRATALICILTSLDGGEGQGEHLLYCNGSFKGLEATTALAEMLSCKLLSSADAGTLHDIMEITAMAGHDKTLCFGEQQNAIAR